MTRILQAADSPHPTKCVHQSYCNSRAMIPVQPCGGHCYAAKKDGLVGPCYVAGNERGGRNFNMMTNGKSIVQLTHYTYIYQKNVK